MATCFNMDNKQAARKLKETLSGYVLVHDFAPKYLGVTLDSSLTYRKHTEYVRNKVKSRCNIISKLADTDWGAPAPVLRTCAMALVYSVAEYCVAVRERCAHVQHVDTQLTIAMRTVSGALRPTTINWLPVFSNIEPPQIRRDRATLQEYKKAQQLAVRVPIKEILPEPPKSRLRSRRPFVTEAERLAGLNQTEQETWELSWIEGVPPGYDVVTNPMCPQLGFTLPRRQFVTLNRLRYGQARCAESLDRWGEIASPTCPSGESHQTTRHIVEESPCANLVASPCTFKNTGSKVDSPLLNTKWMLPNCTIVLSVWCINRSNSFTVWDISFILQKLLHSTMIPFPLNSHTSPCSLIFFHTSIGTRSDHMAWTVQCFGH